MSAFQAFLLGLLQGVTEFLPVSSSGHLTVVQYLFKLEDVPLIFDISLHLATLAAVIVFFRKKILFLFCVLFRWIGRKSLPEDKQGQRMILAVFLGTAVSGVMGIAASVFVGHIPVQAVCGGFIITGFILVFSARMAGKRSISEESVKPAGAGVSPVQGLWIGLAQGIGVLPGISRSGSTIAGALLCGVDRNTAGEFSFLLSIPAILGAFVLEMRHLDAMTVSVGILPVAIGCAIAFVSGLFSLSFLMKLIQKGNLAWFAVYLIPIGIAGIILL